MEFERVLCQGPVVRRVAGAGTGLLRAAFACLVLWPLVRTPRWDWRLIPMTLLFAAMNYSYLMAMTSGSAANAIWMQMTAPLWVLLAGVASGPEPTIPRDWWMAGCVAAGVGTILYFEWAGYHNWTRSCGDCCPD